MRDTTPAACSNIELASLELQRFWGVSKNDHDKLRAKFGRRWCRCCPRAPRPGPVDRVARLSDTAIAFPGAGRASTETVIAFAGEKRVFLVQFSGAEVMSVSTVAVQGCAVVMVVSCWSTSVAAEVSLVSTVAVQGCAVAMGVSCWPAPVTAVVAVVASSPRRHVWCAKKFAQHGLNAGVSAKKFAQRTKNAPKMACYGLPGELFRGTPLLGAFLGGSPCPAG